MNAKTVRLTRGAHVSPEFGACVMEVASMLAGERFSDHPRSVCPVIAAFLRTYNDRLGDEDRQELYPYAAMVVGSASSRRVRRERERLLMDWTSPPSAGRGGRLLDRLIGSDVSVAEAARRAACLDPAARRERVRALLVSLLAVGAPDAEPAEAADLRVPA
jgi:hypothetical protein